MIIVPKFHFFGYNEPPSLKNPEKHIPMAQLSYVEADGERRLHIWVVAIGAKRTQQCNKQVSMSIIKDEVTQDQITIRLLSVVTEYYQITNRLLSDSCQSN